MGSDDKKAKELLQGLEKGDLKLHELEEDADAESAAAARRRFIEKRTGKKLSGIGSATIDYEKIRNRNAENVIGAVQIPVGIAGPIRVNGEHAEGEFYVPMATTEGALIASASRGMKGITQSGGANTRVIGDAIARAPLFELDSRVHAPGFIEWLGKNEHGIRQAADSATKYGRLKEIHSFVLGNNVWVRLSFDTGDAMGMNSATIASETACEYIEKNFSAARLVAVSGNMCSDKKESYVNELLGRGKSVVADALISEAVLKDVFKTTAAKANNTNLKKNLLGSSRAGSSKHNAHFANVVAAIFIATGQDAAQVVESSSGYTWTETRGGDLYISVTMPSLEIGTVGGGTHLATQSEALAILGVQGVGRSPGLNSKKFAEIIAASVLAGELNLLCALSTRELGRAHADLGRNKKR
ncbi:MAG: hydroxymethylglutaryl-CoA reductase (NADPH) [Candidatus Marsarchaeota archaeon]|nr:hydroxymethylglutaryl-CoA reductase (NADPH) [Candidatus Marsarchaeota archaeon]